METNFDCRINNSIIENSKWAHNDSFFMEDEIMNEHYPVNIFSVQINKDNNQNAFLNNENSNPFLDNHKRENDFINDDIQNPDKLYFLTFVKNNIPISNINRETNLTDLNAVKIKQKKYFEIKKEILPKFFTEQSINFIIKQYHIGKELKEKLLFDFKIANNEIEQIKRVLESDTKKRRKTCKNILYRTDHILSKLINIINSSLFNFINNLIASLYSKEKISYILDGVISSNQIVDGDYKALIKKNDYLIRGKLETKEEKLNFFNLTLKKYFSNKISPVYKSKYPSNYNQLIMEKLLNDEDNKDIFDFILNNLLIKDWLEIFLYKRNMKDFVKFNSINKTKRNKIKENLERIDKSINKIYKNNIIYFRCFVLIAYNLSRFLILKEKRNKTKIGDKKKKEEFEI